MDHAQHIANFLVDEARLSANMYSWTNDEMERLITNLDAVSVSLPSPHSAVINGVDAYDFYRTELYLFP